MCSNILNITAEKDITGRKEADGETTAVRLLLGGIVAQPLLPLWSAPARDLKTLLRISSQTRDREAVVMMAKMRQQWRQRKEQVQRLQRHQQRCTRWQ